MSTPTTTRKRDISNRILEKRLFFIVGVPKSGTTWVQQLLDFHPKISCRGEAHFVDLLYSEISRALESYNRSVVNQGGIVGHLKKYGGHVEDLAYDALDSQYLLSLAMALMFRKWEIHDDVELIGEKTPDNIRSLTLLSSMFPDARFIHLIRDGRDCAVSGWFFHTSGVDKHKRVAQTFTEYATSFAKAWSTQVRQARQVGTRLGRRYKELFYEELVADPLARTGELLEFLGMEASDQEALQCVENASFKMLSGGREPGEADERSFYRKGVVGDWKNHFDPALSSRFEQIAGDALRELGYL